jgi:hypothetical protein
VGLQYRSPPPSYLLHRPLAKHAVMRRPDSIVDCCISCYH